MKTAIMKTAMKKSKVLAANEKNIGVVAKIIREGDIAAFPTETVYGIGANALDETAVDKIFIAKGRPSDNPLIVHISDEKMLKDIVSRVPQKSKSLMKRFWPGPLTIVFPKSDRISDKVTAGLSTVAVRMPANRIALELIKRSGVPIAAPSANKSGKPSPTNAKHVADDFEGLIVLDGGETQHGLESTVISVSGKPVILRLGAITHEQLKEAIPDITIAKRDARVQSPGMKYKHYAPKNPLILFRNMKDLRRYAKNDCVVLCKTGQKRLFGGLKTYDLGKDDTEAAKNIYSALRDAKGKEILILAFKKKGIGKTIMDRLERAATKII